MERGIRFDDIEIGKRTYNYNGYRMPDEYYIYQWKPTNDLPKEHPTGAGKVHKNYNEFLEELKKIIKERSRKQI